MIEPADYAGLHDAWVTAALLAALLVVGAIGLHGAADSARRRRLRGFDQPPADAPGVQVLQPPVHIITETEVLVAYGPVHRVRRHPPHAEARAECAAKHAPLLGAPR